MITMRTIVEVHHDIQMLAPEWEALAKREQASPFLWPGWFEAWWRAFGSGELHILAARQDGDLVGVLPLRRSGGVLSSATNPHTPLFGFLAANETAAKELARALFSRKARRIELSFMSPADASLVHAAAEAARYTLFAESLQALPYITTEVGWDAYEARMRTRFSKLRRRQRKLEEKGGKLALDVSDGGHGLASLLEEGFRVEGLGWKDAYRTSINSHPSTRGFYTEIARWAAGRGWLRLAYLRLGNQTIAFDYCFEYDGTHCVLKTGYDPAHRVFAPGMIIRRHMIARAFSEGLSTYDFLGTNDAWKQEWTNAHQEQLFLHLFAPTTLGSLDRTALAYSRSAAKRARNLARSVFGERSRDLVKRGLAAARAGLGR